ncbi:MAG: Helix-turn-helix domain [Verrucomicrobiales bacterium]|nr:Helix-turn-helix domain [Verrucomicrobiales bacterium]
MKTKKPNLSIRALRVILGLTQAKFATMIGVSTDTIISVELGRNTLSNSLADRIFFATGVETGDLAAGNGSVRWFAEKKEDYTKEHFEKWKQLIGSQSEELASTWAKNLAGWTEILLRAAVRSGRHNKNRLPAVYMGLVQALNQAREDFKLEGEVADVIRDHTDTEKEHDYLVGDIRKYIPLASMVGFVDSPKYKDTDYFRHKIACETKWDPLGHAPVLRKKKS